MNDTEEKEVEETRKLFQDFLLEIPEDYLIKRAAEIERELDLDLDEEPKYTKNIWMNVIISSWSWSEKIEV